MDPADALARVAYLMDRMLAPARKAEAFAKAAEVIRATPPDEVRRLHAAGHLTDLPGIGASTAAVAALALDGGVPDRLAELEEASRVPLELDGGVALRQALKGDCHTHSTWSDGGASIEDMARAAMVLGHEYLVLTDHSPRLTVAHGLNRGRLLEQLDEVDRLNAELDGFRILTGIEVDILPDGSLDQDEDLLARLDVVVASVHSKLSMDERAMTERMVKAVASPYVDILGHVTGRKLRGLPPPGPEAIGPADVVRLPSRFDAEIVFAACARFDVAVEVNCRPERRDPPDDLLDLALEWDCRLSIDTDAHAPAQLEWLAYGCDKAARFGIGADRVVNALAADDLLAWTASHD